MRKARKSRVHSASISTMVGMHHMYFLVVPFDKNMREIPTSVSCAYNAEYYTPQQALRMAQAL